LILTEELAQILSYVLFSMVKVMFVLILRKNGLGYILGDFFTNTSGHPGGELDS
jgi:hypothetical protein